MPAWIVRAAGAVSYLSSWWLIATGSQELRIFPAFVVGSPRSGTSILVDVLLGAGYHGYREGNFLTLYATFERMAERHFATYANGNPAVLASVVDRAKLTQGVRDLFKQTTDALNPVAPWFDKTGNPDMLAILPALKLMWPDAVFIFAKRRALENIGSRIKKFPGHTFEYHCADWAKNMSVWRGTRPQLPAGCYVEVDQQDMLQNPDLVARSLAELLDLDENTANVAEATFRRNRPQQTSEGSAARIDSLAAMAWTDQQKEVFGSVCGPELEAYGYSTDQRYWR